MNDDEDELDDVSDESVSIDVDFFSDRGGVGEDGDNGRSSLFFIASEIWYSAKIRSTFKFPL